VQKSAMTMLEPPEPGCAGELARFFPELKRVCLRAFVSPVRAGAGRAREAVVLEFAGAGKAIFSSALPFEFEDRVRLENGNDQVLEAKVIAVQYRDGKTIVAVHLSQAEGSWVNKP
jgi:hypothetical protein